ncbi:hypothetical protein KKE26_05035 [bacterium]|nr:hypothetical protein [bacterium]
MEAAEAVRLLVEPPSAIQIIEEGIETILYALNLAAQHKLTARHIHDARMQKRHCPQVYEKYTLTISKIGSYLNRMG